VIKIIRLFIKFILLFLIQSAIQNQKSAIDSASFPSPLPMGKLAFPLPFGERAGVRGVCFSIKDNKGPNLVPETFSENRDKEDKEAVSKLPRCRPSFQGLVTN
jgi:hypothetical protein